MSTEKPISIVKTVHDVEKNLFYIVFNSTDLRAEIFDEEVIYPEGTFFITMPNEIDEMRYAIIPTRLLMDPVFSDQTNERKVKK